MSQQSLNTFGMLNQERTRPTDCDSSLLSTLLESINLLDRLAQCHLEKDPSESDRNGDSSSDDDEEFLLHEIEELILNTRLYHTPLPLLAMSVTGLHKQVGSLRRENLSLMKAWNNATDEISSLQKENLHLKETLKEKTADNGSNGNKRSFFKNVQERISSLQVKKEETRSVPWMVSFRDSNDAAQDGNTNHSPVCSESTTLDYSDEDLDPSSDDDDSSIVNFMSSPPVPTPPRSYSLKFPGNQKVGLQFQKVPCNDKSTETAFVVCGFHGFDQRNNDIKPAMGARLVAIDQESLESSHWTDAEFQVLMRSKMMRGIPFTLSFRNEVLTVRQKDVLRKAILATEKAFLSGVTNKQPSRRRKTYSHPQYRSRLPALIEE